MNFFKRHRPRRRCPLCKSRLENSREHAGAAMCPRCLVLWHGDTFEPLRAERLGPEETGGIYPIA